MTVRIPKRNPPLLLAAGIALALIAVPQSGLKPVAVWNASPSAPIGLHRIGPGPIARKKLALIKLPSAIAAFAHARGYLPSGVYLLKPIRAIAGDRVCRIAGTLFINGRPVGSVRVADMAGRALPRLRGCRQLHADEILVLGNTVHSFDSRYFGPLKVDAIVGHAQPLWILHD